LPNWKDVFLRKSAPADPDTFPFLVIGNKVDMQDHRRVSTADGMKFSKENGNMLFFECSAKNNINVEQAFKDLGTAAMRRQTNNQENS
jgi:Ras-related protein Rab-7A